MARTKLIPKTPAKVAREAQVEADRKTESKRKLREATKPQVEAPTPVAPVVRPDPIEAEQRARARRDQDAVNALSMAKADATATGVTLEEMCAEMGIDANGYPLIEEKLRYQGPMLALVAARKHYIKAANGILCNGDPLALALGGLNREQVIQVCVQVMKAESNRYSGLNPGQQSMNWRNSVRNAIKRGDIKLEDVVASVERCSRHPGTKA